MTQIMRMIDLTRFRVLAALAGLGPIKAAGGVAGLIRTDQMGSSGSG